MGLRSKSVSLPKLSLSKAIEIGVGQKNWTACCDKVTKELDFIVKSDVCQLSSEKDTSENIQSYDEELGNEGSSKVQPKINTGLKERHDRRSGISRRLRGIFQSLFHLDKREKGHIQNSHRICSQLDNEFECLEEPSCPKSRSLPNLYRTGRSSKKPLISSILRKSKRRINSFRQRNRSLTSFNSLTSNDNLQDFGRSLSRHRKSNGFSDVSVPNSPVNCEHRPVFHSSVECSPVTQSKQTLFSSEETGNFCARLRRERFRRSRTTDAGKQGNHGDRFASFSESSDVTEESDSLDLNDVIISNVSAAVQNRRKMTRKSPAADDSPITGRNCIDKEEHNFDTDKEHNNEQWMKTLFQLADLELQGYLLNRVFDPQRSKDWCSDIGELIRDKVQIEAKGGFKIIVQVFIGAIEDDGIRTAAQCNLNPRCDNFTVVSFRNNTLFAFASLFIVDVREL